MPGQLRLWQTGDPRENVLYYVFAVKGDECWCRIDHIIDGRIATVWLTQSTSLYLYTEVIA